MRKRMTIMLDEAVYEGLNRTVGKRRMSQFIEDLLRPHVLDISLDDGYQAMAADDYVYSDGIHSAVFESLAVRQVWRINGDGCRAFLLSCRYQEIS